MKKISIIYLSRMGNVEVLANSMAEGVEKAGAQLTIKHVENATFEDVALADAVAFGSPSLNNNNIDQMYLAPYIKKFKLIPKNNKSVVLFGSYGWDNGEFMKNFKALVLDCGFDIIGELAVNEVPSSSQLKKAEELGILLAK